MGPHGSRIVSQELKIARWGGSVAEILDLMARREAGLAHPLLISAPLPGAASPELLRGQVERLGLAIELSPSAEDIRRAGRLGEEAADPLDQLTRALDAGIGGCVRRLVAGPDGREFLGRRLDAELLRELRGRPVESVEVFACQGPLFREALPLRSGLLVDDSSIDLHIADVAVAAASHAVLASPGVPRMMRFFEALLQLAPNFENRAFGEFILPSGFRLAFFRAEGKAARFFDEDANRGGSSIGLTVHDIEGLHKRLLELADADADVEISGPPKEHPWGERSFLLVDPDGNRWEITESVQDGGMLPDRD